jgi:hypothetical protein
MPGEAREVAQVEEAQDGWQGRFVEALLDKTLPAEQFDHAGHLKAAWLFMATWGPRQGAEKCALAIRAYAESLGATGKFNQTLTMALLSLVAQAMARDGWHDWEDFRLANPELFADVRPILARHYTSERLASDSARKSFLEPDLEPLPEWPAAFNSGC